METSSWLIGADLGGVWPNPSRGGHSSKSALNWKLTQPDLKLRSAWIFLSRKLVHLRAVQHWLATAGSTLKAEPARIAEAADAEVERTTEACNKLVQLLLEAKKAKAEAAS